MYRYRSVVAVVDAAYHEVGLDVEQPVEGQLVAVGRRTAAAIHFQAFALADETDGNGVERRYAARRGTARAVGRNDDDVAQLLHQGGQHLYALGLRAVIVRDKYQGAF